MNRKPLVATLLSVLLAVLIVRPVLAEGAAPTVDGNLDEWGSIQKQASTDGSISYWQVAKDAAGNVYLAISGTASTQWSSSEWEWGKSISSTIKGSTTSESLHNLPTSGGETWEPLKGTYSMDNQANGNTAGPIYIEACIDASSFGGSDDYSIGFAGTTVSAADIPTFGDASSGDASGNANASEPSQSGDGGEAVDPTAPDQPSNAGNAAGGSSAYNGITIDGNFSDWDAVQKTAASDPNPEHPQNLAAAALVFDHDYAYIYVEEGRGGSAAGAGTHSNGQFAITTDLGTGNGLLVQFKDDGTVTAGGQPVSAKHVGAKWEVAVPKSMLPTYEKTINFGLYQQEPIISGVANLDSGDSGNAGDFHGITYDGDFSDWKAYPHTLIQYATAGTQESVPDGRAALYSKDGTLYSHVETEMPEHLSEGGGEFLKAVTYDFGDDRKFYPNFGTVDSDGTIHLYTGGSLGDGTHELHIFDSQGWGVDGMNINSLNGNHDYGRITVSVQNGKVDEAESEIDLDALAQYRFNCDANDFKTIKGQFGRIGQQWVETEGTPTLPWLGVGCAVAAVVAGGLISRGTFSRAKRPAHEAA